MGSDQSRISRQREYERLEREREILRQAREQQLQEAQRLEQEKNNYRRAREDLVIKALETQQLQEAIRRSNEQQSQLYPNLNNVAGSSRTETYQTPAAAPNLTVNHDHFSVRFQPTAPPAPLTPTVRQPSETQIPKQSPHPFNTPKRRTETESAAPQAATPRGPVTTPLATTARGLVTSPQMATARGPGSGPQATTARGSGSTPQATTARGPVSLPQVTTARGPGSGPQATTARGSGSTPQATTARGPVSSPQVTTARGPGSAPQATTARGPGSAPQATTVRGSGSAPQAASARGPVTAPQATTARALSQSRKDGSKCCKTCKKPYKDKIFQCKNGHSACEACWSLDLTCGVCRGPITNIRNFDLENYLMANQSVKCPNAADGCILTFKKSELAKHEKECPFKEMKCPALGNCNWIGKISQLSAHFEEQHPSSRQANVDTEMYLPNICNEHNSIQLIKLGVYHFLLFVRVSEEDRRVYMTIKMIGTKTSAAKWNYEIHIYNKREPRRKYQYVDICHSSNEITGFCLNSCAALPLPYAMSFVNEGKLTYKFFIKKNNHFNEKLNKGQ